MEIHVRADSRAVHFHPFLHGGFHFAPTNKLPALHGWLMPWVPL